MLSAELTQLGRNRVRVQQVYHPRVWYRRGRAADSFSLPEVTAARVAHEMVCTDRRIEFSDLVPSFVEHAAAYSKARWVNVVRPRSYGGDPHFPDVFHPDLSDLARLLGDTYFDEVWANSEGIAIASNVLGARRHWTIPRGDEIFAEFFKVRGYRFLVSDAGKVATQLIRRLGSRGATSILADLELLRFFDKMARGYTPTGSHLLEKLKRKKELFAAAPKQRLVRLLEAGMLRVGLEVPCENCGSKNWVALQTMGEVLTCDSCLENYRFPVESPPTIWKYRAAGPFGAPGYARGAYSTLLAIRFLERLITMGRVTWTPSFKLTKDEQELEADFAMIYQWSQSMSAWPQLLLGESKSENAFHQKDVVRLRSLAKAVTGAFLVVASLKDQLTTTERRLLLPLAKAAWRSRGYGSAPNHLIVLTGKELFWSEIEGGTDDKRRRRYVHGLDSLVEVAAETQRANLGFDPYAELRS